MPVYCLKVTRLSWSSMPEGWFPMFSPCNDVLARANAQGVD